MSIGSVIEMPTPTAEPLIAPITGLVQSKMRSTRTPPPSRGALGSDVVPAAGPRRSNVSPPDAEVGAGAERPPGAGHDHRPHGVVGVGLVEGVEQLLEHRAGEGVELLGPVQRDDRRRPVDLVGDLGEGHGRHRREAARSGLRSYA